MKLIDVLMAPRKAAEAKRLRERQQGTRNAAYDGARMLCEAAGLIAIDIEYGRAGGGPLEEAVATAFARAAYNPEAETSAIAGAIEGFKRHREAHPIPG